jgi:hypothetical protein
VRTAIRIKSVRGQTTKVKSYPGPVGGWNGRDPLAAMKPHEAIVLNNWFPKTSYVEIRGGWASHATGMTNNGKTLMVYNAMTGTNSMFCSTSSGIYNVSSPGAVGASVLARTNGKHQWVMFGDGTSNWLIAPNGVDAPAYYDGTSWTAVTGATSPALTGITTTDLISVTVYKGRLFFIQKNSLSAWYLPAGVAGGALTELDLSAECKRGGFLMAMAVWTRDAGDGQDDVAIFITSEGEALVYQGNNPASATAWGKIGAFFIGKPIGRRCVTQYGGDLLILTQNGVFPMSAALQTASIDYKFALSFKIEKAFTDAARSYSGNFGWEATIFPAQSALIVNVPISEDGEHEQYVMNTTTKAWCKFVEWDAEAFAVFNGDLYYTVSNTVRKAWTGVIDGTSTIEAYGKTAFSYFGSPNLKHFKLMRPVLSVNGNVSFTTEIDVDFNDEVITAAATYATVAGGLWDVGLWDEAYWGADFQTVKQWTTTPEWAGYCAAGKLKIATNALTIQWVATEYVFEEGGILS